MAQEKIRLGIIGANVSYGWGMRAHLPALKALPEYELVAVCTTRQETAQASAQHYGARKAYWDHNVLVNDPEIDVVDVCVRVPHHYELVMAALRAGKHVFCEWPLGANSAQAEEMTALAREKNLINMVGLQARGSASFLRFKELVEEGYLGQLVACNMSMFMPGTLRPRPSAATWSARREAGVNALTIATGHAMDIFCRCLGEFDQLAAVVTTQMKQWPVSDADRPVDVTSPDNILVTGRLINGAVASVHVGNIPWHGSFFRMEAYGTEGTLVATSDQMVQYADCRLRGARHDEGSLQDLPIPERLRWAPKEVPEGPPVNMGQMFVRFAQGVREGKEVTPDFQEAVQRHHLLDALQRASDTKGWVTL